LTHFAAPPVLMVAAKWGLGMVHMLGHFGYKAVIAIFIATFLIATYFKAELSEDFELRADNQDKISPTWWMTTIHVLFLGMVVLNAHHMVVFLGLFLFFLGFVNVTSEYQDRVQLKESLLVGFFLGGLVVLGSMQKWWLQPLISNLDTM